MSVHLRRFITGPLETNTYLLSDDESCVVVDPSSGCSEVIDWIGRQSLTPKAILLTHAHFDHIMGIGEVQKSYPGPAVWVHEEDRRFLGDSGLNGSGMLGVRFTYDGPLEILNEGHAIVGGFDTTVIHVPGHTPGGCAFLFEGFCLVGDCLFAGSIGRSDFPGGNGRVLIDSIKRKLLTLPDETVVYPGHGEATTVGAEKHHNPFLV